MNGYLVMLRCEVDDVPLYLAATRDEASAFANSLDPSDNRLGEAESKVLRMNLSEVKSLHVFRFEAGKLAEIYKVGRFEKALDAQPA